MKLFEIIFRNKTSFFFISSLMVLTVSCRQSTSPIFGVYHIYSNDPAVKGWVNGENTYIEVRKNNTIAYNSTMNGKPKFHFEGEYEIDRRTNTLNIQWKEGKLPNQLRIDTNGNDFIIQIGTTIYKKVDESKS